MCGPPFIEHDRSRPNSLPPLVYWMRFKKTELHDLKQKHGGKQGQSYSPGAKGLVNGRSSRSSATTPPRRASPRNPKRRAREASRALEQSTMGTKAQQALASQWEATKRESVHARSQRRADEAEARFEQRKLRRKQKHRGH